MLPNHFNLKRTTSFKSFIYLNLFHPYQNILWLHRSQVSLQTSPLWKVVQFIYTIPISSTWSLFFLILFFHIFHDFSGVFFICSASFLLPFPHVSPGCVASWLRGLRCAAVATSPRRWWRWPGDAPSKDQSRRELRRFPTRQTNYYYYKKKKKTRSSVVETTLSKEMCRTTMTSFDKRTLCMQKKSRCKGFRGRPTLTTLHSPHHSHCTSASWEKGKVGVGSAGPRHRTTNFTSSQGTKLRSGSSSHVQRSPLRSPFWCLHNLDNANIKE